MRKAPQHSAAREILSNPARRSHTDASRSQEMPKSEPARTAAANMKGAVSTAPGQGRLPENAGEGNNETDVLILGAGASGLMCAREAAARGLRVTVLERGPVPGRKLAVSGGGKANFTNRNVTPQHYHSGGTRGNVFCAPALKGFTPEHMLRLVREWNLPFEERTHGQLFLTVPAQRMVTALMADCRQHGCRILCKCAATAAQASPEGFTVATDSGQWHCKALVLALGSPAWPQAGGSGTGYRMAEALGHKILQPRPVLAPLLLKADSPLLRLTGISVPARITANGKEWQDDLLFTHEGLSGPAALKASLFWKENTPLSLDFLPDQSVPEMLDAPQAGKQTPRAMFARLLPQRLVDALLPQDVARRKTAELSRAARQILADALQRYTLIPNGTAGLKKAEACAGGVSTDEIDPKTMGSKVCPNLYVTGELLDVAGLLGGYNLHWAWASGVAAGRSLARELLVNENSKAAS